MKLSLALIGSVLAGPQMFFIEDGNGQILDWHGPHGGHHQFFDGVEFFHGAHGGPSEEEDIAIHGHGPHGGHPKAARLTYKDVFERLKQQKQEREEAAEVAKAAAAEGHAHGGHGHHSHGNGANHHHAAGGY